MYFRTFKIWDTRAGRLRISVEKHFGAVTSIRDLNSCNIIIIYYGLLCCLYNLFIIITLLTVEILNS